MTNKAIKIAGIGDSLTEGHGSSNPATKSYPAQLQEMLGAGYRVCNFGVGARTGLKYGLENDGSKVGYMCEQAYRNSLEFLPDIVFIMFGTNDTKEINTPLRATKFKSDMEEMALSYINLPSKPRVFLLTPPWVAHDNWSINEECVVNEIIPSVEAVAKKLGIPCIDMHKITFNHMEYYTEDGVHLNDYGYSKIAEHLRELVE